MRYQIELGPRMPSTRTSAGSSFSAAAGIPAAPLVQRRHRFVLGLGPGDLDQRHRRDSPAVTDLRAPFGRFLGRAQSVGEVEQRVQAARGVVHALPRIADLGEPRRHGARR